MRRIGIAASKMAKGDLFKYHLFVTGISCLFSLLLFLISGFFVLAALLLISIIMRGFTPPGGWMNVVKLSMTALGGIISLLGVAAIIKNIKFSKHKL